MNENQAVEILLVEDNPEDLELTQRALRKAHVSNHIQVARDGEEALQFIFCEGPHAGRRVEDMPKVILLDLKLPKVDGLEVLKRIKGDPRTKAIPVVMLTSSKEQSDLIRSYNLGVNSYIVKPVNFEGFVAAVQQLGMYWLLLNQPPKAGDNAMPQPLKVLIAEDNPADAEILVRALRRSGFELDWKRVDTEQDFLVSLHPGLDLVISDYEMPQFTGLGALQLVKLHCPDVPFVIVSGTIGEDTAVEAMRNGAMDYLMKDRLARLGEAVNQALEKGRLRRQNRQAEQKMREQLDELLRWQEIMLDREERVQALKTEINTLLAKQNLPPRYSGSHPPL